MSPEPTHIQSECMANYPVFHTILDYLSNVSDISQVNCILNRINEAIKIGVVIITNVGFLINPPTNQNKQHAYVKKFIAISTTIL